MNILADEALKRLAARHIRRQIRQLTGQMEGIRTGDDIEFIHRARVAARRLRTGLTVFDELFGPHRVEVWRKDIRRAARGLGAARDKDVQIEFVREIGGQVQDRILLSGIARVLVRWEKKREKLQPDVSKALSRLLASRALHEILAASKTLSPKPTSSDGEEQANPAKPEFGSAAVYQHAADHVTQRFDELWVSSPCLANPDDIQQHHAMRIATKRLRYTIEIYKSAYGDRLDAILEPIKQIQTFLGDIHDCDVWVAQLKKFCEKESRRIESQFRHKLPLARLQPGIDFLCEDRRKHRRETFAALVRYWEQLGREGFWDCLRQTIIQGKTDLQCIPQ